MGRRTYEEQKQYETNMRDKYGENWRETHGDHRDRGYKPQAMTWQELTDPNNSPSDEDWERGREMAIAEAKKYMQDNEFDSEDYDRELAKLTADWDKIAADRLSDRIRAQEDALISEQRDIATGRVHGKGTILASEQLHLAGQTAQAGARGLSGRAATRSRVYGRSADDLRLRGAQAVRTIRDQEKEQAQANVVQMQLARDKGDLVQAREAEAKSLQDELLTAEEEANTLSIVLGVAGAAVGGVAGWFGGGGPAGAIAGAGTGYGIGASIGANV